jgi:hypothetical protein
MTIDGAAGAPQIVVASLGAERTPLVGQENAPHVSLVPTGVCHGAPLGEQLTLCGLVTESLSWFPGLAFAAAEFLRRCESCLARVHEA